jgi:hypothetical protein
VLIRLAGTVLKVRLLKVANIAIKTPLKREVTTAALITNKEALFAVKALMTAELLSSLIILRL